MFSTSVGAFTSLYGMEPKQAERTTDTSTQLYMPRSLHTEIKALADSRDRPLAREIRAAIRGHIDRNREVAPD
jgi:hypothetical protein